MSLLARAKLSVRGRLFSVHSITALQQSSFYSTKTTPKTQRLTYNARTQEPSQSSSLSERIKEQTGSMVDWPKPIEIPYQAKVANSLNLIGRVKTPVQFDSVCDGNHFAATVISQENGGGNNSLLIPVVFEGNLAHVVACHVKENDCVFVSGHLSMGPMRFAFSDGLGKFHIVAENLSFVEGFVKNVPGKKPGVPFSSLQIENPLGKKTEEVIKKVENDEEFNQKWKEALENAKVQKFSGENDWASSSSVIKQTNTELENSDVKKKKNGDSSLDLWRDLVKSPRQWWDYRCHKLNGLVKEKYPDFRHKETGDGLWANSAPDWVLPGFEKLEFDVKFMKAKPVQDGKEEDSWKNLVEYPNKWWDNRLVKKNPRAPDFKHKETGDGLWANSAPDWVLPGLEKLEFDVKPVQSGEGFGEKKEFNVKFTRAKQMQGGKGEDSWKNLVEYPNKWWDNRLDKKNPKAPDFKHKETGDGLWADNAPDWVLPELEKLEFEVKFMKAKPVQSGEGFGEKKEFDVKFTRPKQVQGGKGEDFWKNLVEYPNKWWDTRLDKKNPRAPDFKHKETGDVLWANSAPDWVLPELDKLKFDVKLMKAKPVQSVEGFGEKGEDSWKNLVEYPNKWWDNRLDKKYPRVPDFKHKETGEGLWLNDSPDWALPRLPLLKDDKKNM